MKLLELFEDRYIPEPNSGCWLWIGGYHKGYGRFKCEGVSWPAHRASYVLFKGQIPAGMFVCHKCDNPVCVNPEHLFLGTTQDNTADMVSKGRQCLGSKNPSVKLTEQQVRDIIKDGRSQRKIAQDYGISQMNVWDIKKRNSWKHLAV